MSDLIYPATNSGIGDMSAYDIDGKKHRESMVADLMKQYSTDNFVVSGLEVTAGTGLDVSIATGECNIEGRRVVINTARTHTLVDDDTNYVYLQLQFDALGNVNGVDVVSNTTGAVPSNSLHLANITTVSGSVDTIVDERGYLAVAEAINADTLDGQHFTGIQNWVNDNADVPNSDHADESDNSLYLRGFYMDLITRDSVLISDGNTETINLNTGGSHALYLFSVYAGGNQVAYAGPSGISNSSVAYIITSLDITGNDVLRMTNRTGGDQLFSYEVYRFVKSF